MYFYRAHCRMEASNDRWMYTWYDNETYSGAVKEAEKHGTVLYIEMLEERSEQSS